MKLSKQQMLFIKAFRSNNFNITKACKIIRIARQTYYNWMDEVDDFSHLLNEVKEEAIDFVESALMAKIEEGDIRAIIWFLKTKGKSRGYSEKAEIDLKQDHEPVVIYLPSNGREVK